MEHQTASAVDKGKQRPNNEDQAEVVEIGWVDNNPVSLLVLADGMGGQQGGEIASQTAVTAIIQQMRRFWQHFNSQSPRSYGYWLSEAAKAANQKIYSLNRDRDKEMGTTLVAALVIGRKAFIVNIGDSRAYHISNTAITQITTDQSVVQGLIGAGLITPEQARQHPLRGCITQAVGSDEKVDADLFAAELETGDTLLLCSDGLTNELDDATIYDIIQAAMSPQSACDTLIAAANAIGGRDNISVVLVQLRAAKLPRKITVETLEMIGV